MDENVPHVKFSSDSQHGDVTDHVTSFPMDNAALADIRTDEDIELKPGDETRITYRKRKGVKKYKQTLKTLVPYRAKPK